MITGILMATILIGSVGLFVGLFLDVILLLLLQEGGKHKRQSISANTRHSYLSRKTL